MMVRVQDTYHPNIVCPPNRNNSTFILAPKIATLQSEKNKPVFNTGSQSTKISFFIYTSLFVEYVNLYIRLK